MAMASRSAASFTPLAKLLTRQGGVISMAQAVAAGLTPGAVRHRTRPGGPWQQLMPGVYLTVTGEPNVDQADLAALLFAGDDSMLTGLAALRRYTARGQSSGQSSPWSQSPLAVRLVDVLIPEERRRLSRGYVVMHRTTRMPGRVGVDQGICFALPTRAVADAALGMARLTDVRALIAAAVQQGLCTVAQLADELEAGPRRHSGWLRTALAEVGAGVRSVPEGDLRLLLARSGLPTPLFNSKLYVGSQLLAVPDVWWPQAGVVVEVDSREWHFTSDGWERTMRRHARLTAAGLLVLHFSPRQIRTEPAEVVAAIAAALRQGRPATGITTRPASD